MNDGINAIIEEIFAPCFRSSENPCRACVEIGVEKAFRYGLRKGEEKAAEEIRALIGLKDCSKAQELQARGSR